MSIHSQSVTVVKRCKWQTPPTQVDFALLHCLQRISFTVPYHVIPHQVTLAIAAHPAREYVWLVHLLQPLPESTFRCQRVSQGVVACC